MADNQPPKPPAYLGNRISLHVKITVAPENVAAFLAALKPCWDAVVAEKECVFFEVFQKEPGEFCFIENWHASMEHLMTVQLKREYYKPYLAATEPMYIKPREFELWNRMEAVEWVMVDKSAYDL